MRMHKMNKLVYGVGVNDADYVTRPTVNGKQVMCLFYQAWSGMLERCYSAKCQARHPTYIGCSVAPEWYSFMTFRSWMVNQDWEGNHLDKDLLVPGNKEYNPSTCAFVSRQTNNLLTGHAAARGDLPIGVSVNGVRYQAGVRLNNKRIHLGRHSTQEEAHESWLIAKVAIVLDHAMGLTDERIKAALMEWCNKLK